MYRGALTLAQDLDRLAGVYGSPAPPPTTDPFELIVWENVVYLADDARRAAAFAALRERVGLSPEAILNASPRVLEEIAGAGILAHNQANKLRASASLARELDLEHSVNRQVLKKFPAIGEPGADKVLLFSRREAVPALDSNGVRVLTRLGYVTEGKSYATTYRAAVEVIRSEWEPQADVLMRAYLLLRAHGQELCKRSAPRCDACPLNDTCDYAHATKTD